MKLSKRLMAIYNLIPDNVRIVDVGCDHALLDIYSVINKHNVTALAIEKTKTSIKRTIDNINKYNLNDYIIPLINDGLSGIKLYDNDYVIIAGMGTYNIISIIKNINVKHLIVQSNTDSEILVDYLLNNNYIVKNVLDVLEGRCYKIYELEMGN